MNHILSFNELYQSQGDNRSVRRLYHGTRELYKKDGMFFAEDPRYAKSFGRCVFEADINVGKVLDLKKDSHIIESYGMNGFMDQGFFTLHQGFNDEK